MNTLRAYIVLLGVGSLLGSAMTDAIGQVLNVNCTAGESIQQAVDEAIPGDTITVEGTCSENVTIVTDAVILQGAQNGDGVNGRIRIVGAQRVVIHNLRVTGDNDGVKATKNAVVTIQNSILENNSGSGAVSSWGAVLTLAGNTIRDNGPFGVVALDGGKVHIRENNTIESDALDYNVGAAVAGFRQTMIHITSGGNTITNTAFMPPTDPVFSNSAQGFAICMEHNSNLRQDQGAATINGAIEVFNLTSVDIREANITGWIFVDGFAANFRMRNSTFNGSLSMGGPAGIGDDVNWTGNAFCFSKGLNPNQPTTGNRIDCFP